MLYSAFLLGLIGSLHCVGMCGPLTLLLPDNAASRRKFIAGRTVYNLGRVATYTLLGLVLGLAGEQLVAVLAPQKWLSVVTGFVLLAGLLFYRKNRSSRWMIRFNSRLNAFISRTLSYTKKRPFYSSQFLFGMANGLLPCGMVYAALAGAFLQTQVWQSGVYMTLFGLGTLPLMLASTLGLGWVQRRLRFNFSQIIPIAYGIIAVWLIFRGFTDYSFSLNPFATATDVTHCVTP